jgi:drug/metabolite transporter (DMT)-like permease
MDTRIIGILLIIIGAIMVLYTGFNYLTKETVVDIGPLLIETKKNNFVKFSPFIGSLLLIGGIVLLLYSRKSSVNA